MIMFLGFSLEESKELRAALKTLKNPPVKQVSQKVGFTREAQPEEGLKADEENFAKAFAGNFGSRKMNRRRTEFFFRARDEGQKEAAKVMAAEIAKDPLNPRNHRRAVKKAGVIIKQEIRAQVRAKGLVDTGELASGKPIQRGKIKFFKPS